MAVSKQGRPQPRFYFLSGQLVCELLAVWPPSRQSCSLEGTGGRPPAAPSAQGDREKPVWLLPGNGLQRLTRVCWQPGPAFKGSWLIFVSLVC